ncbi:MAG: protein-L-isoaspartate(D-aspartate) O-methyltransferase [Chloroflexota bacterium]
MESRTAEDLARIAQRVGVVDPRLLRALAQVPRHRFLPPELAELAYVDGPVPIGHGQTSTQPSLSALMIDALQIAQHERVLEIGTGSGYQTALLASLAAHVVSIELFPDLAERAADRLRELGYANVEVHAGDGTLGHPEGAPYHAIIVSAAFPSVPPPLIEQLADGGRLIQPVGEGGNEVVTLFQKTPSGLTPIRDLTPARFVRLWGAHGFGTHTWE